MSGLEQVRTTPLFVMQVQLHPPQTVEQTPLGVRKVVAVAGGTFTGDRLSGVVLPHGGHDWALTRVDGTLALDVRLTLRTDDDAIILMTYRGFRRPREGQDPYFRIAPFFETGSVRYAWLNSIISVGIGQRPPEGPRYEVSEVR